jgi:hypothetical protein
MAQVLLLSILIALVVIPLRLAHVRNPRLALRRMAISLTLFTVFYLVALRFVWPRLL